MPHLYRHRGYPLKCLTPKPFGKGCSYKDGFGLSNGLDHNFRVALKGGAGGVVASKRKKQELGQPDLATALTSFLQNWSETASTKRQRHSQTQEQSRRSVCFETNESTESKKSDQVLAKKLIQVLKNCINQGQDDEQVTNTLLNHLGSRSKFSPGTVSPKPKYRTSYYDDMEFWDSSWDSWYNTEDSQTWPTVTEANPTRKVSVGNNPNRICATKIDTQQWTPGARLTTFSAIQEALQEGSELPGNLWIPSSQAP